MIGVGTNVLVRYIVVDDPEQSRLATAMIDRLIDRKETIFVSQLVFCELVWVLSFAYKYKRDAIVTVLHTLRRGEQVVVEGADEVKRAIDAYAAGRGDLADFLIAEAATSAGCSAVATFDRDLHADPRFRAPERIR